MFMVWSDDEAKSGVPLHLIGVDSVLRDANNVRGAVKRVREGFQLTVAEHVQESMGEELAQLIRVCTAHDPAERPRLNQIRLSLKALEAAAPYKSRNSSSNDNSIASGR